LRKFKCKVEKTYEYEIEIDETVWTEDAISNWSSVFYDADDLEDVARILAEMKTRYDSGEDIEGFGIPMIDSEEPYTFGNKKINHDINIHIIDEDDVYVDCEEI